MNSVPDQDINKEKESSNKDKDNIPLDDLTQKNDNIEEEAQHKENLNISANNNIKNEKKLEEAEKIPIDNNFLNDFYKMEDSKIKNEKTKDGKSIIDINELLDKKEEEIPITLDILQESFENYPLNKISSRSFGIIKAYGVNTSQGIIRDYNEDRVSIVINMVKPSNSPINNNDWPKISYFGVFDGHAGSKCADFLKDNLIKRISNSKYFPNDIRNAIKFGFQSAERDFLDNYAIKNGKIIDKSGSCALILLTVNNMLYVANVGDSRCLISCKNGKIQKDVTRDHKPNYPYERERIIKNNGIIYQSETPIDIDIEDDKNIFKDKVILGPYRVNPGRLSVSRTIGDAEAKTPEFGGNPNVIISQPDVYCYDLEEDDVDFFILGCDGVYDQLSSKDVLDCAWMVFNNTSKEFSNELNINCGNAVDLILKMSMIRKSYDNVTCLIVAFKDINKHELEKDKKKENNINVNNHKLNISIVSKDSNNKPVFKLNKNKEKNSLLNKNKLPLLQLKINQNKTNNFGLKKLFKNNNNNINIFNYINKINANRKNLKKKEDNFTIRNNSVPRQQNKIINKNSVTINKNDFSRDRTNIDYSEIILSSNNNYKKIHDNAMLTNLTEPNYNRNFKNHLFEKSNRILTNSTKHNRIKSLDYQKNSSNSHNDEEVNDNSASIIQGNSIKLNMKTPITLRIKNDNNKINYLQYYSVNKKNSLLVNNSYTNNSAKQIKNNNKIHNLRLKPVEKKLPLYQKAYQNKFFLERNRNNKSPLNLLTYDKNGLAKKDNRILNEIKCYPVIEEKNNTKNEKPIKLKLELLNINNHNNTNTNHSDTNHNLTEGNKNDIVMPLIIQPRKDNNNQQNNNESI